MCSAHRQVLGKGYSVHALASVNSSVDWWRSATAIQEQGRFMCAQQHGASDGIVVGHSETNKFYAQRQLQATPLTAYLAKMM